MQITTIVIVMKYIARNNYFKLKFVIYFKSNNKFVRK